MKYVLSTIVALCLGIFVYGTVSNAQLGPSDKSHVVRSMAPLGNYRGECDWSVMYTAGDVAQKCWIPGSTTTPADGDLILMTGGKELWSSADPCGPEGRTDSAGDNEEHPPVFCVYTNLALSSGGNTDKRWRTLDVGSGASIGVRDYYDGSALVQNYSDGTLVVFSRPYNTAGGGPLENGGIIAVCGEDGTWGTENQCDPLAVTDNEGKVVFLVETQTADGDPKITLEDGTSPADGLFQLSSHGISGWATGAGVDGTTNTIGPGVYIDTTPAGEWTAVDGDVTVATEATIRRKTAGSLSLAVAASSVEEDDGAFNPLAGGDQDWSDDESFGLWMRCDTTTAAGDWNLSITDNGTDTDVSIPALTVADTWTWLEVDVSAVANADKDIVTDIGFTLSAAGATAMLGDTCYFEYAVKWDAADEEALGLDIMEDGILSSFSTATAAGSANTPTVVTEGTDFFIHYESGNDFLIAITDQSSNSLWGTAALE